MAKKNSRPNLAARKSASKKAEEKKIAAQKAYWEAHKKQILTIAAIVVAAIIVLALAIDYLYVPANSVRDFMGNTIGVNENAIIRELNGRYYEFGTMDQPAGYEDLSVNAVFSKIDFEKPIGYFRHESIKNFTKQEYKAKKEELYAMYDKIINALLNNARYTEADNDAFKTLLNIMIEPSLKPMYTALDEEFYKKYLA